MDDLHITLTTEEAYAVAEFIDFNIFDAIRNDPDWDSAYALRNLIHAYEKCCILSGYNVWVGAMMDAELTKNEAYAVAEFIDMNIFTAIRTDEDWDSFHALKNLIHAYEKCCEISHKVTERKKGHWIDGSCSVCGCDEPMFIEDWNVEHCKTPFCPNCGADMRGAGNV